MASSSPLVQGTTAVFGEQQWASISQAISPLNGQQLTWLSGYLAGLAQISAPATSPLSVASNQSASLTILYGSQTGNAKGVAQDCLAKAQAAGFAVKLVNMADYKSKQLKSETHLLVIVSTHGEGEAPDDAVALHEFLASKKAPQLPHLHYAVVGLGDSSYEFFCQTAKDFDQRLADLGAKALHPRLDCDVDYEAEVQSWYQQISDLLPSELKAKPDAQVVSMPQSHLAGEVICPYNKKNPFSGTLSLSQKITGRDSVKAIYHVEISLEDSGIHYQPGDALGVYFCNDDELVAELLKLSGLRGDEEVTWQGEIAPLARILKEQCELTLSYPSFVKAYAAITENAPLRELAEDAARLHAFVAERQIIDIVRQYSATTQAQALVDTLRPLAPRLYSIASSQAEVEDEVHLTVALVEYHNHEHLHQGGASSFLTQRLLEGDEVKVYVESNSNFRLPEDPSTPVIMIGPGTGIAPFRAFMQERAEQGAQGKNWLFFGNPNYTQDFLYQTEWQRLVKDQVLSKVSLAFSRDQAEKIYVQHRMLEQGAELFSWLEQGAHIYVCGDAQRMAKDVHQALISLIKTHGQRSFEQAEAYLTELRKAKRYQKDVY